MNYNFMVHSGFLRFAKEPQTGNPAFIDGVAERLGVIEKGPHSEGHPLLACDSIVNSSVSHERLDVGMLATRWVHDVTVLAVDQYPGIYPPKELGEAISHSRNDREMPRTLEIIENGIRLAVDEGLVYVDEMQRLAPTPRLTEARALLG